MRLNPLIILAAGGMLMTAAAAANEPTQPQAAPQPQAAQEPPAVQQAQPAPKAAPPKLICRMETEIGSLSKKRRVCRAARQRAPANEASRDASVQGQTDGSRSAK